MKRAHSGAWAVSSTQHKHKRDRRESRWTVGRRAGAARSPATAAASLEKATQLSDWWVLKKVKKQQEGSESAAAAKQHVGRRLEGGEDVGIGRV